MMHVNSQLYILDLYCMVLFYLPNGVLLHGYRYPILQTSFHFDGRKFLLDDLVRLKVVLPVLAFFVVYSILQLASLPQYIRSFNY